MTTDIQKYSWRNSGCAYFFLYLLCTHITPGIGLGGFQMKTESCSRQAQSLLRQISRQAIICKTLFFHQSGTGKSYSPGINSVSFTQLTFTNLQFSIMLNGQIKNDPVLFQKKIKDGPLYCSVFIIQRSSQYMSLRVHGWKTSVSELNKPTSLQQKMRARMRSFTCSFQQVSFALVQVFWQNYTVLFILLKYLNPSPSRELLSSLCNSIKGNYFSLLVDYPFYP